MGRALLETAGLLLAGTIYYWRHLEFDSRDRVLNWDGRSWAEKLSLSAVRFDQNRFETNALIHSGAGVAHYQIARGNGFGVPASVATTLVTSVFWEFFAEFKEYPSLNDLVTNTVAGVSVGEPFYRLGEFFLRSSPSWFNRGVAVVLSPIATTSDWIDRRQRPPEPSNAFGLNQAIPHRLRVSGALVRRSFDRETRTGAVLNLDGELVMVPGYGRSGRFTRWAKAGDWSAAHGRIEFDHGGLGVGLLTRTSLLGRYTQDLTLQADGQLYGHGTFLGIGSAFEYERIRRPSGSDYLASLNIAGPVFEFIAWSNDVRLRWRSEVYGNFTMVKALAFEGRLSPIADGKVYRPGDHGGRIPGSLGARGYYHGAGVAGGTRIELDYRNWEAGGELRADYVDSITGRDRFREELVNEYDNNDQRVLGRMWLGLSPSRSPLRISTGFDWRWRRGQAEELVQEYLDTRLHLGLSLVF